MQKSQIAYIKEIIYEKAREADIIKRETAEFYY